MLQVSRILIFILLCQSLFARQPFHAEVTVDGIHKLVSAPNLVDLNRALKTEHLQELFVIYTPISPVSFEINLRDLKALAAFGAGSTTLTLVIPNAGITETFTGGTRDESLTLFKAFIKEGRSLKRLLKAYARYSPIDPIAGNPSSLLAKMGQADYLLGELSPLSGCSCFSAQAILHQFQAGLESGRAFSGHYDTTTVTLPLRYSYSPDRRWALILDAPFTYLRNGGASSVFGSLGTGLRVPLTDNWSITSIFRLGTGGSLDLCTSGSFVSLGATSVFNYKLGDFVLSMTNYGGYFSSTNLWLTGLNFNYHLHNGIIKNGFSLTTCEGFCLCGRTINYKISFEDTCVLGDRLYNRHFDAFDFAFITTGINPYLDYDLLSTGFSFQWGEKHYKAYTINFIYQF